MRSTPPYRGKRLCATWEKELTSLDYVRDKDKNGYYALVSSVKGRIFVYCLWNGDYCTLDARTGRILNTGKGDEVLMDHGALMPLRVTLKSARSSGKAVSDEELEESEKEELEVQRRWRVTSRSRHISGSEFSVKHVVGFDAPAEKRCPLFVIAWKSLGGRGQRISFRHLGEPSPTILIDGHVMQPLRTKRAVYALQPDYTLKALPLTDEEITRLFSDITRSENRNVASIEELEELPAAPYWEEKVDPHLSALGPSRNRDSNK